MSNRLVESTKNESNNFFGPLEDMKDIAELVDWKMENNPRQTNLTRYHLYDYNFVSISEISHPEDLMDSEKIFCELKSMDWAFTTENTSFLTHDIHPYPAKFIPHIPAQLISRLSFRGDLILDPFGGSGTTAFEAIRLGRRAISIDANPIANLIAKVKTTKLDNSDLNQLKNIERSLLLTLNNGYVNPKKIIEMYSLYLPKIPNRVKWFPDESYGELAQIKYHIGQLTSTKAKWVAQIALSKIVTTVSFQDSETRYASRQKDIKFGETTKKYLRALKGIVDKVLKAESFLHYGIVDFITADTREISSNLIPDESIDLIVTSPPYGNAYDYHLYHRFRLLWLGYNPKKLGEIEIGSHLRHQYEKTGFESYLFEMSQSLKIMYRVLKSGRYISLVVGDSIYSGILYNTAESLAEEAKRIGFQVVGIIPRSIHSTKRSVVKAGRRAKTERILLLQKPPKDNTVILHPPPYALKDYEVLLRRREIISLVNSDLKQKEELIELTENPLILTKTRRLAFTHHTKYESGLNESTWQAKLENGLSFMDSCRKEPKYVTHGIHPYKGKFYPQLAKALINISGVSEGAIVLDPFCGSGTTLLECYLNGLRSYGCDMNPVAAKIAAAKTQILDVDPDYLSQLISYLIRRISDVTFPLPKETDQFPSQTLDEVEKWFPYPVIYKINWLLKLIRSVNVGVTRDYFEIILSSIIREISQQEPRDLRVRRRKVLIDDADVFDLYIQALKIQHERIEKFWTIRGYSPYKFIPARIHGGDSREIESFVQLGLQKESVDLILTSPPYATALPYIDTDRLSLLVLFGLNSSKRRPLDHTLIGSREISKRLKQDLERDITSGSMELPDVISEYLTILVKRIDEADVGFRRQNMPALLLRFFRDMKKVLQNGYLLLKDGGEIMIVIGDNSTSINGENIRIPTTDFVEEIALCCGFKKIERIPISVTTENLIHIKNAITKNVVLRMRKKN